MFRKLAESLRGALKRSAPGINPTEFHPSIPKEVESASVIAKNYKNEKMQAAHADLQAAVKELSQGVSIPVTVAPPAVLLKWNEKPVDQLELAEIEELARAYFEGNSALIQDKTKAFELWTVATQKDSIEARYSRALCLKDGIGTDRNPQEAHDELKYLADEKNYHLANYSLAVMLDKADGIPEDPLTAFKYYKKAALGGVQPALHNLANAYAAGRGVKQSDHNALLYYEAASESGDPLAHFTLGLWYYHGRGGLTPDPKKSFTLQSQAAEVGHPAAMFNVGTAYLTGDGIEKDFVLAVEWLEKAAKANVLEARFNLAKVYMDGPPGIDRDWVKAKSYVAEIADRHEIAKMLLEEIESRMKEEQGQGQSSS